MRQLKLEAAAEADIDHIIEEGIERFGLAQADLYHFELYDQFKLLAEFPRLGRPVGSQRYPSALKFGFASHVIVFSYDERTLTIHRLFHARSNYTRYL